MYKHILVPVALDHGPNTEIALNIAQALKDEGGKITALHVSEPIPSYVTQYLPEGQEALNHEAELAEMAKDLVGKSEIDPVVIVGHAGRDIVDYAKKHEVDCIVIASHRPGLQDYFLGSTAARVVRHATCAVHVVR